MSGLAISYSKHFFRRNRPPAAIPGYRSVIEPADQFSFPSGHTSAAFLVATTLAFALPWTAWFMYPWAIGVGMSRVVLGVHFPTDTIAGAAMGFIICHLMIVALAI
ncbi:MAG: phosphatase PAP2 family protein [Cellvibrionaceae bacterium]|nr:phosphatase PAP2 family protein [Cellvibrionaceae bacterium]